MVKTWHYKGGDPVAPFRGVCPFLACVGEQSPGALARPGIWVVIPLCLGRVA
jgi:hypothetical protein